MFVLRISWPKWSIAWLSTVQAGRQILISPQGTRATWTLHQVSSTHQRLENVKVRLLCHTLQHFCLHFVTHVWQFDIFFFSPKFTLKNQKHCCKFAQCRQSQNIIIGNQLMYSIYLKHIPSLVTKCWCLCQSHKEVIESNVQVTFQITLHI
jgi:hypothetical protein